MIDLEEPEAFEAMLWRVSTHFSQEVGVPAERLARGLLAVSRAGLTPQARGVALPHLRLPGLRSFHLALVRPREGVEIPAENGGEHEDGGRVRALFFLLSPESSTRRHLAYLAELAERVDQEGFIDVWLAARTEQEMKEALLHAERFLSIRIAGQQPSGELAGREIREISFVSGALIALVHREGRVLIPTGRMRLEEGDRLTIVGDAEAIGELRTRFGLR